MENRFMTAEDVAQAMGISKAYAYKIIRRLNAELEKKGYLTVSGKVNAQYFRKRTCYAEERKEESYAGL